MMISKVDPIKNLDKKSVPVLPKTFLTKPPLPIRKKPSFFPKIQKARASHSRNVSNDSSAHQNPEDSFSMLKSNNDSNNISYISTNSNSSITLNNKKYIVKPPPA